MTMTKTMISALAISAIAGTAAAVDFSTFDTDANGQIDFAEYKAIATKDGKTVTLAAQEFTSMSQGDAIVTEAEFLMATTNAAQNIETEAMPFVDPMAMDSIETVTPAEIFLDAPQSVAPVETGTENTITEWDTAVPDVTSDSMTSTTEIEVEPEVAGEVTTSDDWTDVEIATPELTMEPDNVPETDADIALEDDIIIPEAPEVSDAPIND